MDKKKIQLKISPDGTVQAEILGFPGTTCADYISVLEELLQAEAVDSEWKPEYSLNETEITQDLHYQTDNKD